LNDEKTFKLRDEMNTVTWVDVAIAITAVYGAVLSTVILIWQYRNSRPNVHISITEEYLRDTDELLSHLEWIVATVTNSGTQPVALTFVGFVEHKLLRKKRFFLPSRISRHASAIALESGKSIDCRFKAKDLADEMLQGGAKLDANLRIYVLTPQKKRFESKARKFLSAR
jgi:hypothetical protein